MEIALFLLAVIAVAIGVLLWSRRDRNTDDPGTDPEAHPDLGTEGPPRRSHPGPVRSHPWGV